MSNGAADNTLENQLLLLLLPICTPGLAHINPCNLGDVLHHNIGCNRRLIVRIPFHIRVPALQNGSWWRTTTPLLLQLLLEVFIRGVLQNVRECRAEKQRQLGHRERAWERAKKN